MKRSEQTGEMTDAAGAKDKAGAARVKDPSVGRTGELRGSERLRGDTGGGPKQDGQPDVPHAMDDKGEDPDEELAEKEAGPRGMKLDDGGF